MNGVNISKRLSRVADMLEYHTTMADIGTDHGYLPIYTVKNNICKHVIAADVNKGPLNKAKENIEYYNVSDRVETRLSNGLSNIACGEADSVVITGMGGMLIVKILTGGKLVLDTVNELVLSAQSEIHKVRYYLNENGYKIDKEDMVFEDGKYYQIMHVIHSIDTPYSVIEARYGRCLLKDKNPVMKEYLIKELEKCSKVKETLSGLLDNSYVLSRKQEVNEEEAYIKEALDLYEM